MRNVIALTCFEQFIIFLVLYICATRCRWLIDYVFPFAALLIGFTMNVAFFAYVPKSTAASEQASSAMIAFYFQLALFC